MNTNHINFEEAKAIATKQALLELGPFMHGHSSEVLWGHYLEAEYCWMFFRNPEIQIPKGALLGIEWAYVVSKKGAFSLVQDFSYNAEKLHAYLKSMSDYFKRRGE